MKVNKYLLIIALANIANYCFAEGLEQLKERMEKIAALSNEQLNEAYFSASDAFIKDGYEYGKVEHAFQKCKNKYPHAYAVECESLNKKVSELWNDRSAIEALDDIIYEKHRRQLYEGFVGRGSVSGTIGARKVERGWADLYRGEKNLQAKSEQELLDQYKKVREKLQKLAEKENLDLFDCSCIDKNNMKLLAIERELQGRQSAN